MGRHHPSRPFRFACAFSPKTARACSPESPPSSARRGANIRTFESGGEDNTRARIEVALDVRDRKQLEHILAGIKRIPGVFDIERVYNV